MSLDLVNGKTDKFRTISEDREHKLKQIGI
jgi:hypothetical protein